MSEMREPTVYLLSALAGGRRHGYALIQEVAQLSQQRVVMRPGTLYGALDRLLEQGLVVVAAEEVVDGRLRRYYELTEPGAEALASEAERLRRVAAVATGRARLGRIAPA